MHRTILFFAVLLMVPDKVAAQWVTRQAHGGGERTMAVAFTVGNTAYVGGGMLGQNPLKDFWAYDAATDTWTRKADLPGGNRLAAVGFSIGSKGYIGTGANGNTDYDDFWEYDATADRWTQRASFPGGVRQEAVGFAIDGKGYIGTGQHFILNPNNSFTLTYRDFWAYDPAADSWTQKADLPGAARAYAVGTAAGGKGYIGLGGNDDQSDSYTDFYEYNPATNTWTQKAGMPGNGKADAGIVAVGNSLYVVGGINFPNLVAANTFRRYDIATNAWTSETAFGGGAIVAPVALNVAGKIYAGTGYAQDFTERKDWWRFTPSQTGVPAAPLMGMSIYPNPVSDDLTISLPDAFADEDVQLTITDVPGKLISSYSFRATHYHISTAALKSGCYFLHVSKGGVQSASYKLVRE